VYKVNHEQRKEMIDTIIAADPYTCTVRRKGDTSDDDELKVEGIVGRIIPAGARGVPMSLIAAQQGGEVAPGRFGWILLTTYIDTKIKHGDEIEAVHDATGTTTYFLVAMNLFQMYKQEVLLDELQ
jgi:hypothetical protein